MLKIEAERYETVQEILRNQQLEGIQPDAFGMELLDSYVKGKLTIEEAIKKLDQRYKDLPRVKMA